MTMRGTIAVLGVLGLIACQKDGQKGDSPSAGGRTTILERPGDIGYAIAPDGRLAYGKFVDGKSAIYVANADGSNARRLSFGVWDYGPRWSPDGKWIAFGRDAGGSSETLIIPADSGAERPVGSSSADESPTGWLPTGAGLVFARTGDRGGELWEYTMADGSVKRLFNADGSIWGIPSHDGTLIAYMLQKAGKTTVWLWDRTKNSHRQLTTDGFEAIGLDKFSPDDRSLLYSSRRTGTSDLWRVDVASGDKHQLTTDVAEDFSAQWSRDGSRIAFVSTRGGQPDVWVLSKGEEDVQRVTDDLTPEAGNGIQWAPDGKSLVMSVTTEFQHFYSVPLDGGPAVQLSTDDVGSGSATLSRDKTQIAYQSQKNGDDDIWVRPVAGGDARLVSGGPGFDGNPEWSPDGQQIAFTSVRGGTNDIWVVPAAGGAAKALTDWPTNDEFTSKWSPDGKTIVFLSNRDATGPNLWLVPSAGGAPRRLASSASVGGDYKWSPDSKTIAFTAFNPKTAFRNLYIIDVAGGTPRQLTTAPGFGPSWAHSGKELASVECDAGYCAIKVRTPDGKLVRSLTPPGPLYEFGVEWSSDDSQVLITYQDLVVSGGNEFDIRSAAGGAARKLKLPVEHNTTGIDFTPGDKAVIAWASPVGQLLQRIPVPAARTP